MHTKLKKAFSGQSHVKMEDVFDLTLQLETRGVHQDVIDGIIEDFELSQVNGTYRAQDFIREVVGLYELSDGGDLSDLGLNIA